jgi:adenine-specific DNA-methyltransferase
MSKPKLELTWIGKDQRPQLEPRILLEDPSLSHHAPQRVTDHDLFDNRLIFGDNLLALKALEQEFTGKITCVCIDPPYNTGAAFTQYDDGIEHSLWLSLIRDRLEIINRLLCNHGSMWIFADDNEAHYLKVLCDEVFGRTNFVATCVWEKDKGGRGDATISQSHDNIFIYAKDRQVFATSRNLLPRTATQLGRFRNPDNDPRGPWRQGDDGTAKSGTDKQRFKVVLPSGREVVPPPGRYWAFSKDSLEQARLEGRAYFGIDGDRLPIIKRYLSEVRDGVAPRTWWSADEVGTNQDAKRDHLNKLLPDIEPFATPKPESVVERILRIASNPGDIVLDSFAGSGTTGAVAHKMGRRWIMVELGEHCHTHIIPRLKKVIDGEDPGGVTEATGWQGGGGYRYFRLAPSLMQQDSFGNWVISREYNPAMLAEAICKLEGFRYQPSDSVYWQHGQANENDFIYVTTQSLSREQLTQLADEVGPKRSLLVMCGAFRTRDLAAFPNLTIKKIPKTVLDKCEWGHDDYSLAINNLPGAPTDAGSADSPPNLADAPPAAESSRARRKAQAKKQYRSLFDAE